MTTDTIECEPANCVVCGCRAYEIEAEGYDYLYWTSRRKFCFVRCPGCGHVYLHPRPRAESLPLLYPANYYTRAGRHTGAFLNAVKSLVIRRRLSYFKPVFTKPAAVLEIGCGDGSLLVDLKKRYPWLTVSGVDIHLSQATMKRCRTLDIRTTRCDIESLDLPGSAYDLVIMNQLVEHLRHPERTLEQVSRALKPGGLVSIETPEVNGYDRGFFKKSFWGGYYFPRHLHLFSFRTLERLLADNGLETVRHFSLVAPLIWIFSVKTALGRVFPALWRADSLPARIFGDENLLLLALFTLIDGTARLTGRSTSNQKIIARKADEGPGGS